MPNLIFHCGITKTASTFLQKQVFGGKMNTMGQAIDYREDMRQAKRFEVFFRSQSPYVWSTEKGNAMLDYARGRDRDTVVSHESLYEHIPFRPREKREKLAAEPLLLSRRLGEINRHGWEEGDVKAMVFVRKQQDWLPSIYAEVSYDLPKPSQRDFEERTMKFLEDAWGRSHVLAYDALFDALAEELGIGGVLMLPYEMLKEDEAWDKISTFVGYPELKESPMDKGAENAKRSSREGAWNSRHRSYLGGLKRMLQSGALQPAWKRMQQRYPRLLPTVRKWLPTKSIQVMMTDELQERVRERYAESNSRLAAKLNINLADYGYFQHDA